MRGLGDWVEVVLWKVLGLKVKLPVARTHFSIEAHR